MTSFMKTASSITLIAALAASPIAAVAQTATDDAAKVEETENSDTSAETTTTEAPEAAAEMETAEPETDGMAAETAEPVADPATDPNAQPEMAESEPAPKPVEGQIVMQDENTILASDLIGTRVYSAADDDIGEINDMIVGLDGTVEGVVIGVGGFLGIGEKGVAVQMATLSVTTDEGGDLRLVTSATKADLEAAEAFMSKEEQESARAASAPPAADATNGTGIGGTADPAADPTVPLTDPAAPAASN